MSLLFFPSCKVKANYPEPSARLLEYLGNRYQISTMGCCKVDYPKPAPDDTAVVVCNSCAAICEESSKAGKVSSVWELVDDDPDFQFPDYGRMKVTMQDCWRSYDNASRQTAVRSLLTKMNIEYLELAENFNRTRYCGPSLLDSCPSINAELAPERFVKNGADMFRPFTPDEQKELMRRHCENISTDKVVGYCTSCVLGANMGGRQGLHLVELVFKA